MNIKIFENDDHLVIDISKNGLKNQISENAVLISLLNTISALGDKKEIPGLAPEIIEEDIVIPQNEGFLYNGKVLSEVSDAEKNMAMLSLWDYQRTHSLKMSEVDAFKEFVRENLCFIDENTETIGKLKNFLDASHTSYENTEEEIRLSARKLIDDMISFAIMS